MTRKGYTSITVRQAFYDKLKLLMDRLNDEAGFRKYTSIGHLVETEIMASHKKHMIPLEHFNVDEEGVTILDRNLNDRGRMIHVNFKPEKIFCEECETEDCRHVDFALSLPEVQSLIYRKGWKIKDRLQ